MDDTRPDARPAGASPIGSDGTGKTPAQVPAEARAGAPERRSGWPRPSVTVTLSVSIGALVGLSLFLVILEQWTTSRKNTYSLISDIAGMISEYMDLAIHSHLDPALKQVEFVGTQIDRGFYGFGDEARLENLMIGALAATPQVGAIVAYDFALNGIAAIRVENEGVRIDRKSRGGDPLLREVMDQMSGVEGSFWGRLVFSGGETLINVRRPLRRDGRLIGFLAATISMRELSEVAAALSQRLEGTVFILYGKEQVVAHPNLMSVHPDQSPETPTVPLSRVGDLVLANIWSGKPLKGFEAPWMDVNLETVTVSGEQYLLLHREVRDFGEVPWVIGAWYPLTDVDTTIARLERSAAISAILFVLALLAALLLGRLIARPIRRLAAGTSMVGELDLAHVNRLEASGIKELDDQARAFNTMLASLKSFETYVPRSLVMRLIQRGEDQEIVSEDRELTVMFTDIAGFTAMSERLPADDVAQFLNEHFALLGACVEAEGGTADKFIGDALMAFWGAPDAQPDTAPRACRAALAMAKAVAEDNDRRERNGQARVHVRIGIHTGRVVVGNIGWPGRMNYTIVGDTVNACQRLESLGRSLGCDAGDVTILISEATADRLPSTFLVEHAGSFGVKGKTAELDVYRLLPP